MTPSGAEFAGNAARRAAGCLRPRSCFVIVILTLTADFVYARVSAAPPQAQTVTAQDGAVHIPTRG